MIFVGKDGAQALRIAALYSKSPLPCSTFWWPRLVTAFCALGLTADRYALHRKYLPIVQTLQSNDFELFGLDPSFNQHRAAIDQRWKELQQKAHPDRFASQGASAQRIAMQWSVRINEAYQRLKDPLKRASYLCELNGAPVNAENNSAMPVDFLMQQIEWREALDDAKTAQKLDEIAAKAREYGREQLQKIEQSIDIQGDFQSAVTYVRSLMFVERFASEVESRIEQMPS